MGILRGGLLIFISTVLLISVLLASIFLTASLSLNYDILQPELTKITTGIANDQTDLANIISTSQPLMLKICRNQTEIQLTNFEIPYNYSINCDTVRMGPEEITSNAIEQIIKKAYYKDYDCKLSECIVTSPLYIISETNKNKLKSQFYKTLIISLLLIAAIFLLVEKKKNTLTVSGIIIILASLPLIKIDLPIKIFSTVMGTIPNTKILTKYLSDLILLLFSKIQTVINFNIALGTMLIVLGIGFGVLKFLTRNIEKKFTKKDVEEIVNKKIDTSNKRKEIEKKLERARVIKKRMENKAKAVTSKLMKDKKATEKIK